MNRGDCVMEEFLPPLFVSRETNGSMSKEHMKRKCELLFPAGGISAGSAEAVCLIDFAVSPRLDTAGSQSPAGSCRSRVGAEAEPIPGVAGYLCTR